MGNNYSDKDRAVIVKLHLEEGRTRKSLCEEFSISESTLGRWIIRYKNGALKETEIHRK